MIPRPHDQSSFSGVNLSSFSGVNQFTNRAAVGIETCHAKVSTLPLNVPVCHMNYFGQSKDEEGTGAGSSLPQAGPVQPKAETPEN